jgi:hypothetical protein
MPLGRAPHMLLEAPQALLELGQQTPCPMAEE